MFKKISNNRSKLSNGMLAFALLLSSIVFPALFDDTQAPTSEPIQTELVLDGKKDIKKHISYKKIIVSQTGIQSFGKNIVRQQLLRLLSDNNTTQKRLKQNLIDIIEFDVEINSIQKHIPHFLKQEETDLFYS